MRAHSKHDYFSENVETLFLQYGRMRFSVLTTHCIRVFGAPAHILYTMKGVVIYVY